MEITLEAKVNLYLSKFCKNCEGEGEVYVEAAGKHFPCLHCQGKGIVITKNGQELLDFIKENTEKARTTKRRRK